MAIEKIEMESREGIIMSSSCNCSQDNNSKMFTSENGNQLSSKSRSSRRHYLFHMINVRTVTGLIALFSLLSVICVSESAVVKSSDILMKIGGGSGGSGLFTSGSVDDPEFSQQSEVNSPVQVAQCRATCLQKFNNNRLDGKASSSSPCFTNSDCFTCWKSCELLETLAQWSLTTRSRGTTVKGDDEKSTKRSKSLSTMCSQSPRLCLAGCQVACGFYENLMKMNEQPLSRPVPVVVATKRENVLHISSGKIEWPQELPTTTSRTTSKKDIIKLAAADTAELVNSETLVYVLIQQYPDLKWRQIIQTTDTSVEISKRLSTQMANKLRNVRVLVVSPNGLVSIYYPEQKQIDDSLTIKKKQDNEPIIQNFETTVLPLMVEETSSTLSLKVVEEESFSTDEPIRTEEEVKDHQQEQEHQQDLYALRTVSLIHQKSLVIAELTWNPVKYSEDQEYLITWELDGGGLKGHLVTDATTVSLSLWPSTLYHIQVELFEREEEEEDGEQDEEDHNSSKPKSKSLPLTVDTSEAEAEPKPSALSNTGLNPTSGHKSVSEFLNVTLLLTVSSAALLVLGSLLLALSWHNMVRQRRRCSRDPQLLQDTDDSSEEKHPSTTTTYSESPSVAIISPAQLVYPSLEKVHQEQEQHSRHHLYHHSTKQDKQWSVVEVTSTTNQSQSNCHNPNGHHTRNSCSTDTTNINTKPCWWPPLSTRESNNHYHINNSSTVSTGTTGTRMHFPPSCSSTNSNSLPGIQK